MADKPDFQAYAVIKREGKDDWWLNLGAAFVHKNGDGYNVILQALPIPNGDGQCKIVLRPPKDAEDDSKDKGNVQQINKSGSRRR